MFIKIMTLLSLIATLNSIPVENHSIYMRGMEIVNLDYNTDIVTCVDAGNLQDVKIIVSMILFVCC